MYIDASEIIRLRVESDEFTDDEPGPVKVVNGEVMRDEEREREREREGRKRKAPYVIIVSIYLSPSFQICLVVFRFLLYFLLPRLLPVSSSSRNFTFLSIFSFWITDPAHHNAYPSRLPPCSRTYPASLRLPWALLSSLIILLLFVSSSVTSGYFLYDSRFASSFVCV
jgi:hypothetical protein